MLLGEDGDYSFEVVDGHAYACYTPQCISSFHFYGAGALFEAAFITSVSIHPLNNLSSDVKGHNTDISFNSYDENYYVNIELSVLQTYVNKQVVIDFTIDQGHLDNGAKFRLEFVKEEHNLGFDGECPCGTYRSDKIYHYNFSESLSISLNEYGESAFIIFDTLRDNFTLYFDTTMTKDDLSTAIDGFTEHGDYYIRNSLYMVIEYSDKKLEYNNPGVAIKYIAFTNSSYEGTPQNFTVSPH